MAPTSSIVQATMASFFQVLGQGPTLLVLVAGIVLFLVMVRRSLVACLLSAGAFALLLAIRIVHPFVTNALLLQRAQMGWTTEKLAQLLGISSFVFGIVEAAAFGMLIAAVLTGTAGARSESSRP